MSSPNNECGPRTTLVVCPLRAVFDARSSEAGHSMNTSRTESVETLIRSEFSAEPAARSEVSLTNNTVALLLVLSYCCSVAGTHALLLGGKISTMDPRRGTAYSSTQYFRTNFGSQGRATSQGGTNRSFHFRAEHQTLHGRCVLVIVHLCLLSFCRPSMLLSLFHLVCP